MTQDQTKRIAIPAMLASVLFLCSCHKRVASAPSVAPPAPAQATAPIATPQAAPEAARSRGSVTPVSPAPSPEELFRENIQDAYFDYDKSDVRFDAREALSHDADFLRSHPEIRFSVEGHCDERGGEEYNLALGDRRAASTKRFLVSLGITADRIQTVSLGKERPFCTSENESCWQQNRRGHFVMTP